MAAWLGSYGMAAFGEAVEDSVSVMGYTAGGCIDLVSASTAELKKRYLYFF